MKVSMLFVRVMSHVIPILPIHQHTYIYISRRFLKRYTEIIININENLQNLCFNSAQVVSYLCLGTYSRRCRCPLVGGEL